MKPNSRASTFDPVDNLNVPPLRRSRHWLYLVCGRYCSFCNGAFEDSYGNLVQRHAMTGPEVMTLLERPVYSNVQKRLLLHACGDLGGRRG